VGLGERVTELEEIVARFQDTVAKKDKLIDAQAERIKELEAALEEARRAGKRQASPFSKGEPKQEPGRPGRKAGGAHGRHGHRMAPAGPPDQELDAPLPACCPGCGGEVEHERDAEQWQVDIGEMRPVTKRFRVGVGRCKSCGRRVQGYHPDQVSDALGAAGSGVGPTAKAWAAFLHYSLGLSWVKVQQLMARLGVVVTAGALCQAAERQASTDLVAVRQELVRQANSSPVVVMDETGWRVGGRSAWLWEATNVNLTVYWVAKGRGFDQACEVIDEDYAGTIVRDGWAPYRRYKRATHQTCLGHLLRRVKNAGLIWPHLKRKRCSDLAPPPAQRPRFRFSETGAREKECREWSYSKVSDVISDWNGCRSGNWRSSTRCTGELFARPWRRPCRPNGRWRQETLR
jgi:transposase